MVALQLKQLSVPPGQRLVVHDVSWQKLEAILEELGDHRAARIAYSKGVLEIRMPSPEHEVDKELIGDMVKILLEELDIDCECFGSTTFKSQVMESGIEPDQCFYIQQHERLTLPGLKTRGFLNSPKLELQGRCQVAATDSA